MEYLWQFTPVIRNADLLVRGLGVTAGLTLASVGIGFPLAVLVAGGRVARSRSLRIASTAFVEIFRGLPVLVLLVWLYYCLPMVGGVGLRMAPFWVAAVGLGLNLAALEAEILRAGYESIPRGQIETAGLYNFSALQTAWLITIPQSFWRSLAPTLGQMINTLKLTALASFVTVPEIFYVSEGLIRDTFRPLEFYTTLAFLYLALIIPASFGTQWIEARLQRRFRPVNVQ